MNQLPLNVLVIGAGMYVCGRGTDGYGTILPALYQAKKENLVNGIKVAATDAKGMAVLQEKIGELNQLFGFEMATELYPKAGKNSLAYRRALEKGAPPDCAIISVPDHLHFEITSCLIKRELPCLVVKPLAATLSEVRELIRLSEALNVFGAVEFHKRYDRSNLRLRDVIRQKLIGDPLYFIVEYSQRKSIPMEKFRSWVRHTNILQYLGIHYIDIIYFTTGAIPLRVLATGQKNFLVHHGVDTYDAIQCTIEWEMENRTRFTSAIFTNWVDPEETSAMSDQKIKVIGTRGRYEADQKYRGISIVSDTGGIEEPNLDFSTFLGTGGKEGVSFQGYGPKSILQFIKDVQGIKAGILKPRDLEGKRPTFRESIIPTAILETANRSLSADGLWLDVESSLYNGKGNSIK